MKVWVVVVTTHGDEEFKALRVFNDEQAAKEAAVHAEANPELFDYYRVHSYVCETAIEKSAAAGWSK